MLAKLLDALFMSGVKKDSSLINLDAIFIEVHPTRSLFCACIHLTYPEFQRPVRVRRHLFIHARRAICAISWGGCQLSSPVLGPKEDI
jgi:hypothetical protein